MDIITALSAVPATVWGVLLGSAISTLATLLQNRAAAKRQQAQLLHDSQERDRERKMSMRREVYFSAADGIAAAMAILPRAADLAVSEPDFWNAYQKSSFGLTRLQVVASQQTIEAVAAFSTELAVAFIAIVPRRAELLAHQVEIDALDQLHSKSKAEIDRLLQTYRKLNLEGVRDDRVRAVVEDTFKFEQAQQRAFLARRDDVLKTRAKQQLELLKVVIQSLERVAEKLSGVVRGAGGTGDSAGSRRIHKGERGATRTTAD